MVKRKIEEMLEKHRTLLNILTVKHEVPNELLFELLEIERILTICELCGGAS